MTSTTAKLNNIRIYHRLPEVVVDPEERVCPGSVNIRGYSLNNLTFPSWIGDYCIRMLMFGGMQPKLENEVD